MTDQDQTIFMQALSLMTLPEDLDDTFWEVLRDAPAGHDYKQSPLLSEGQKSSYTKFIKQVRAIQTPAQS